MTAALDWISNGLWQLSAWQLVIFTLAVTHVTIVAVTVYLHRHSAHRAVDLHPALQHFFRLWLWLTTGMNTKEWTAIHRKHHAVCETEEDPHSPQVQGLKKIFWQGAEVYRDATTPETLKRYGAGTPDDWIERNLYTRHSVLGVSLLLIINVALFGAVGLTIWAVQMLWIPVMAAGVINGIGHYWGYRNFECPDAATNIVPWGIIIGGEELHNNHHAFPSSSKFSVRRWEFDIGWLYIRVLSALGLAKVKKVAPFPVIEDDVPHVDLETVRAVIVNRMHVIRNFTVSVTIPTLRKEVAAAEGRLQSVLRRAKKLLIREPSLLDEKSRAKLDAVLADNQALRTVHEFRGRLQELWSGTAASNENLIQQLKEWCTQAEASGIKSLQEFAQTLRGYRVAAVAA